MLMNNTILSKFSIILALTALMGFYASAANAQEDMRQKGSIVSGWYVGFNVLNSVVEQAEGFSADEYDEGDGTGYTIGYRLNHELRIEYQRQEIDYDDSVGFFGARTYDSSGNFRFLSVILQAHNGPFQPYVKLSLAKSDVSEKYSRNGTTSSASTSDTGEAIGAGFDYALSDNLSFRGDFTVYSEHQNVLSLGPIWHF